MLFRQGQPPFRAQAWHCAPRAAPPAKRHAASRRPAPAGPTKRYDGSGDSSAACKRATAVGCPTTPSSKLPTGGSSTGDPAGTVGTGGSRRGTGAGGGAGGGSSKSNSDSGAGSASAGGSPSLSEVDVTAIDLARHCGMLGDCVGNPRSPPRRCCPRRQPAPIAADRLRTARDSCARRAGRIPALRPRAGRPVITGLVDVGIGRRAGFQQRHLLPFDAIQTMHAPVRVRQRHVEQHHHIGQHHLGQFGPMHLGGGGRRSGSASTIRQGAGPAVALIGQGGAVGAVGHHISPGLERWRNHRGDVLRSISGEQQRLRVRCRRVLRHRMQQQLAQRRPERRAAGLAGKHRAEASRQQLGLGGLAAASKPSRAM